MIGLWVKSVERMERRITWRATAVDAVHGVCVCVCVCAMGCARYKLHVGDVGGTQIRTVFSQLARLRKAVTDADGAATAAACIVVAAPNGLFSPWPPIDGSRINHPSLRSVRHPDARRIERPLNAMTSSILSARQHMFPPPEGTAGSPIGMLLFPDVPERINSQRVPSSAFKMRRYVSLQSVSFRAPSGLPLFFGKT